MHPTARRLCLTLFCVTFLFGQELTSAQDPAAPWITTAERVTLLSANDGATHLRLRSPEMVLDDATVTEDSVTVVHLGPDHPPIVKTVYGTVPNSVRGSPYIAMTDDGHYGFVPSQGLGVRGLHETPNLLSVIDLSAPELTVVQTLEVPLAANMVAMHPDGRHLIVPIIAGFRVYEMQAGRLVLVTESQTDIIPMSFDINPAGNRIIATGRIKDAPQSNGTLGVHLFRFEAGLIEHFQEVTVRNGLPSFDDPFSLRFSPDGNRVLVPNGSGIGTKGRLDDILIVDMSLDPPEATEVISQVADGIESLAFHPDGHIAVIACLEELPPLAHNTYSDLAVVDMTSSPPRLLYRIDVEAVPEGIEFTRDGSQLFVQLTQAHRIAVFDVDQFLLKRSPFVIRVGHGPSSMAIGPP